MFCLTDTDCPGRSSNPMGLTPNNNSPSTTSGSLARKKLKMVGTVVLWCTLVLVGAARIAAEELDGFVVAPFRADVWATDIKGARGLVIDEAGDVLVVSRSVGIVALWEEPNGRVNRTTIVRSADVNHGITIYDGHLYASSDTTVWRWRYTAGQRREATGTEVAIKNIGHDERGRAALGHSTRTLVAARGVLYVSVGSVENIDWNSYRARLRSFELRTIPYGGYEFAQGVVFADGLRNEVGLAVDGRGRLWGVENGGDMLERNDLGGDIHNDNPAEEMNLFDGPAGTHYGYPYCWSEFSLPSGVGGGRGTQWAWPTHMNGTITDRWCRNLSNNRPPEMTMQAHAAPLGISFYNGSNCGNRYSTSSTSRDETLYALSCEYSGDAFVTLHGSWNRDVPVGFKVVRIRMNATSGLPVVPASRNVLDVFGTRQAESRCVNGGSGPCIRPVDLKFTREGVLLVTSDSTGEIIRVTQNSTVVPAQAPSAQAPAGVGSEASRAAVLSVCSLMLAIVLSSNIF